MENAGVCLLEVMLRSAPVYHLATNNTKQNIEVVQAQHGINMELTVAMDRDVLARLQYSGRSHEPVAHP